MKNMKRYLALLLCLILCFSLVSTAAFADETGSTDTGTTDTGDGDTEEPTVLPVYSSYSEALDGLRVSMVSRDTSFSFQITKALVEEITGKAYDKTSVEQQDAVSDWLDKTLSTNALSEHTGDPLQGDSLFYQFIFGTMVPNVSPCTPTGSTAGYILTVSADWYTDAAQEEELSTAVEDIVANQLGFSESSDDIAKAEAIYNYLTSNVALPEEDYEDVDYTAYGALVNHTAESLGTALAFYRLALTVGLDARVVTNADEEYYNIVKIGGSYYCLEASDEFDNPVSFCSLAEFESQYTWDDAIMRTAYLFSDYGYSNLWGDVNADGSVNLMDLLILKDYLAGFPDVKVPAGAADMSHDGKFGLKDLLLLKQTLA